MIESTDNGVDFEMQELERMTIEKLEAKYLIKSNDGSFYWNYSVMTEQEQKFKDNHMKQKYPTIELSESDIEYQKFLKSQNHIKNCQKRAEDYRYLRSDF